MTHDIAGYLEGQPPLMHQNFPPGETYTPSMFHPPGFMVSASERLKERNWPQDHDASHFEPHGDERVGLLIGEGRREEALAQLREEADLESVENRLQEYADAFSDLPDKKRYVASQRKLELKLAARAAEKLRTLEEAFPPS